MDFRYLYTSFEGRISRKPLWIGGIVLAIASIVLSLLVYPLFGASVYQFPMANGEFDAEALMGITRTTGWISLVIFLILAYPSAALSVKRRHDRGGDGKDVWAFLGLNAVLLLTQATGIGYSMVDIEGTAMPMPNAIYWVVSVITGILGIYLLVVLGFLKGTPGANEYGPDPLAQPAAA